MVVSIATSRSHPGRLRQNLGHPNQLADPADLHRKIEMVDPRRLGDVVRVDVIGPEGEVRAASSEVASWCLPEMT
jgi:hypothetical protein